MGILLCCLRVPEQDGESRSVPRISGFSYPIMITCPTSTSNYLKPGKEGKFSLSKKKTFVRHVSMTEYTEDNPKIDLQCGHTFHLACIYEWMERSEACPFCSKTMLFLEGEITEEQVE